MAWNAYYLLTLVGTLSTSDLLEYRWPRMTGLYPSRRNHVQQTLSRVFETRKSVGGKSRDVTYGALDPYVMSKLVTEH